MSTRKAFPCSVVALLLAWSQPSFAAHLDTRGGVVTSFQGQSLAVEHRLKPKVSIELHEEWSPGVRLGFEVLSLPDPSPNYFLMGGMGTLRLTILTMDSNQWNLVFGAGIGNAPGILFDNLDSDTPWALLVQTGTEWRVPLHHKVMWTARILSENVLSLSVETGLAVVF